MAAMLPAINPGGSKVGHQPQRMIPTPPKSSQQSQAPGSARFLMVAKKRSQSKKERELEQRQMRLRAEQPELCKSETAAYRRTYKHNLCLDMLQEGFHKSFAELFALIRQQNDERQSAGPESALWNQILLENEHDKLDTLKLHLTDAETAHREEKFFDVYKCQYILARYFQGTGDKWLSDHFFAACLATASKIKDDEGKMAAEGHCNVGLALEESGDYFAAAEHFEYFYKLSKGKQDWELEQGTPMHPESCSHLTRIYTTIANNFDMQGELENYLAYLEKAYETAKEGGERQTEGEASLRLGMAYEKNKNPDTALKYLNKYLETCRALDDNQGTGKACEAIAKSYESQGKVEESIKYLEMFVEVAEKSKDDKAISRACSDLGAVFNSLGRYEQAVEYFNKSYNISRAMNDTETISSSRVLFGVAAAHKMLEQFSQHINVASKPAMERIIEWKDNRGDEFEKPVPEPESTPPQKQEKMEDTIQEEDEEVQE